MFQNSLFLSGRQNFYIAIYIDTHRCNQALTISLFKAFMIVMNHCGLRFFAKTLHKTHFSFTQFVVTMMV